MPTFVAVDLGATSGRVVNVRMDAGQLELDVVHRFRTPSTSDDGLAWDLDALLAEVRHGLVAAARRRPAESMSVDSWGLDYGLLDDAGRVLGPVHAYRSARTAGVMDAVLARVRRDRIYAATGIQLLPFNTAFQLVAARQTIEYRSATNLLMVPDLVNHALCGSRTNELTNASTTQLLDVSTRRWSDDVVTLLGLRRDLLPELHEPGTPLGAVTGMGREVDGLPVVATASHDTASAVAGTPLRRDRPAVYVSCGTWSLVGCELTGPVTSTEAQAANVTNELGVDGSVRLLKNVTGLWLLEECRRTWAVDGQTTDAAELAAAAAAAPGGRSVIDPDDPRFAAPGDMPRRIAAACAETGQPVPSSPPEMTRTILDSLAVKWRATIGTIERIAGVEAEAVHLVGGGAAIELLRQSCASACGRRVLAGPVEATVVGNALVQAVAADVVGSIDEGRQLVERALPPVQVDPEVTLDWDALAARLA